MESCGLRMAKYIVKYKKVPVINIQGQSVSKELCKALFYTTLRSNDKNILQTDDSKETLFWILKAHLVLGN